jgi:hypothetical protein
MEAGLSLGLCSLLPVLLSRAKSDDQQNSVGLPSAPPEIGDLSQGSFYYGLDVWKVYMIYSGEIDRYFIGVTENILGV